MCDNFLFVRKTNKFINFEDIKLKDIQRVLNKNITPKFQQKCEKLMQIEITWKKNWGSIYEVRLKQKIQEFQWKCLHNILYTEEKLSKMGFSNGNCFFCKSNLESQKHLFYECKHVKPLLELVQKIMLKISVVNPVKVDVCIVILGFAGEPKNVRICINTLIYIYNWSIWKSKNSIKYENKNITHSALLSDFKKEMKSIFQL